MSYQIKPADALFRQRLYEGKTLNHQEAKLRLQQLIPCTEEHSQLQNALTKMRGIVEVSLPTVAYKVNTSCQRLLGGFGSSEHIAIGEDVKLQGLFEDEPLFIKGLTPVRFQHIVALAGDFYGIAGEAISLPGGTEEEKTERFERAFNTLAQADAEQIQQIIAEVESEYIAVKSSGLPHHCYSRQLIEKNKAIKKIKSDIDDLLIDNSDHFSINAEDAYRIGHNLARSIARKAGEQKDRKGLKQAYALDAFACHFLTDLFAAGHIRNQRGQLETFLLSTFQFSSKWAKSYAGLLTAAQHEKDGNEGLNVSNGQGDCWRAYGDGCFFTPKNKENRKRVILAVQQSVDEIYSAYENPEIIKESKMEQLLPYATLFNPPPVYSIEEGALFFYEGSHKVAIQSKSEYLRKGISQALRYLPESYVNGFIDSFLKPIDVEVPSIIRVGMNKILIPRFESLTGSIWHIIGLATYYQVKKQSRELNKKIDEMAETVRTIYQSNEQILEEIKKISAELTFLSWWTTSFQEIRESIATIKDIIYRHKHYREVLDDNQLQKAMEKLQNAWIRLARVFSEKTADGKNILKTYGMTLSINQQLSPLENIMTMTLWFRQMLDYQIQAFSLYTILHIGRSCSHQEEEHIRLQVLSFESSIREQLEANREHIDENLIYKSHSHIEQCLNDLRLGDKKLYNRCKHLSQLTLEGSEHFTVSGLCRVLKDFPDLKLHLSFNPLFLSEDWEVILTFSLENNRQFFLAIEEKAYLIKSQLLSDLLEKALDNTYFSLANALLRLKAALPEQVLQRYIRSEIMPTLHFLIKKRVSTQETGDTVLHSTALSGSVEVLKALAEIAPAAFTTLLDAPNTEGETPLHKAAENPFPEKQSSAKCEVVTFLLDQNANPNAKNKYGYTPLHYAAKYGHLDTLILLLERGGDLQARGEYSRTLLHMAVFNHQLAIVSFLLERGSHPNWQADFGKTPLHDAVFHNDIEMVELLCTSELLDVTIGDQEGNSPLWHAMLQRQESLLGALLYHKSFNHLPHTKMMGYLALMIEMTELKKDHKVFKTLKLFEITKKIELYKQQHPAQINMVENYHNQLIQELEEHPLFL